MTAEIKLPEAIGPYRIKGKLGQGGMGVVFHAIHETLERSVALKILPSEMSADPEYVTRFLREARVVATLRQENIVQVYDAGTVDGKYYIAMEMVDGTTLGKYLEEKGSLAEPEGLALLLQASKGLAAAHAKELVHRDIKPDNLLLDKDCKTLRIVDFGLVMESASTTQLTATGACLGTPQYMSPEQADGEKADARTDLYSLGVTFYKAFTGQPPFTSPTAMNLLFKHKFEAPPDPRTLKPGLSENTCNLILTMMAKRREDRPRSAQAVVELIEGLGQGKQIPPPPVFQSPLGDYGAVTVLSPTIKSAPSSTPARSVFPLAAGAAAGLLVLLLAAWLLFGRKSSDSDGEGTAGEHRKTGTSSASTPRDDPALKTGPVATEASLRAGRRKELVDQAAGLEKTGRYAEALARYDEAAQLGDADALNGLREDLRYKLLVQEAAALDQLGNFEAALAKARAAHEIRDASGLLKRLKKKDRTKAAAAAELAGEWALAASCYEEAASLAEDQTEKEFFTQKASGCRSSAYRSLGEQLEVQQDWDGAAKAYTQALALKPDPALETRRNDLLDLLKKSPGSEPYRKYIDDGDRALADGVTALGKGERTSAAAKFTQAHANYVLAFKAKPASAVPGDRMKETEAYQVLVRGDEDKARGDYPAARFEYNKVSGLCPKLASLARQRLQALGADLVPVHVPPVHPVIPAPDTTEVLAARVDQLVRGEQYDEALRQVSAALRSKPQDPALGRIKNGLEGLQACQSTLLGLRPILVRGLQAASEAQGIDSRDSAADTLKERLEERERDGKEKAALAKAKFLNHNYEGLQESLLGVRNLAQYAAGDFDDAYKRYVNKSEEKDIGLRVKVPIFGRVEVGGNKDKADKYRRLANTFAKLAEDARIYGR